MRASTMLRRAAFVLAIAALVAGCAVPQESGPEDRNADKDRNGLPDDWERNNTNSSSDNGTMDPLPVTPTP